MQPTTLELTTDKLSPVKQRIETLDILRGFALFGVLLANLLNFAYSYQYYPALSHPSLDALERNIEWLIRVFVEGSFYPLFSFLFGLGFSLQIRKGDAFVTLFRRRLWILLGIGLLHAIFIWSGDILVTYALIGFILFNFRKMSDGVVLRWVGALTGFSVLLFWLLSGQTTTDTTFIQRVTDVYTAGSYLEAVELRLDELGLSLFSLVFFIPQILSLFLLGMLCGRRGLLEHAANHQRFWQRTFWLCSLVSIPLITVDALSRFRPERGSRLLESVDLVIASPLCGFVYLSGLILLLNNRVWQRILYPLAAIGRMALTNYLMQSVVMTLVFYGYGFRLYSKLPLAWGVLLALALFTLQVIASRWWLIYFHYGLVEWSWRCLTYQKFLPLRKAG